MDLAKEFYNIQEASLEWLKESCIKISLLLHPVN
jgi:hypothetical protein